MKREDLDELHYITAISNMPSIWRNGILSHKRASKYQHVSIASGEIQERRARKIIPGGRALHEYVNLYFCARNPMLYLRRSQHTGLCVLRIGLSVLDLPGVVITDRNAASDWVRFFPSPEGLTSVNGELVFAEYWTHPEDLFTEWEHKSIKCAEVLVPDRVDPSYLLGVYVSCEEAKINFEATGVPLTLEINPYLFFQ
ncbi:MAG: DUF4433 domain-containing protein [Bacillota bacterium]